jgi:hypothetical protein
MDNLRIPDSGPATAIDSSPGTSGVDPPYFLSRHAYVCVTSGYAVFLDLRKDAYTALEPADFPALHNLLRGWSDAYPETPQPRDMPHDPTIEQTLLAEGLITADGKLGKTPRPVELRQATGSVLDGMDFSRYPCIEEAVKFRRAFAAITPMLADWPIEQTVGRVERRNLRAKRRGKSLDFDRARDLIASYFQLQPRAFSQIDACLRNSLTMAEYLAGFELYPTFAIGVRMDPWAAHAWLQHGSVVLNDRVEHIRLYTPILAI